MNRTQTTLNASPTTNATALINSAIDLGVEITECPIGDGFIIVRGDEWAVAEWMGGANGGMFVAFGNLVAGTRRANGARQVLA